MTREFALAAQPEAWRAVLGIVGRCVRRLFEARRRQAERRRAALIAIDEADLSEAGRQARREMLHAIRDARRRTRFRNR